MTAKKSDWELEKLSYFDAPSLESVLARFVKSRRFPDKYDGRDDGDADLHREKTSSDISVHIRSLPRIIWETIRVISLTYPDRELQIKAAVEGCLIHCGLYVLEQVFKEIPGTKEMFLKSYQNGNVNILLDFVAQSYDIQFLGHGIKHTRGIYFLNKNDQARAMEIATNYGMSLSLVTTLAMVAGIAQSESMLPKYAVAAAEKEIELFRRKLIGTKYV